MGISLDFARIAPMVHALNLPNSILEKSKEILMYLSQEMVPDQIMSADGTRTIWAKSGRHPGAVIKVPWGTELFAHNAMKSFSSLSLCYLAEDAAKRAKLALVDRKDLAGVIKDTGVNFSMQPEIVEHAEGEDAPWRFTVTLESQLQVGPHDGLLTWQVVLKVLSRRWENGEAQLCAVINLAYREEADTAGLEFRKFETVFPKVTEREVSRHFKNFQRQRTMVASTRLLDPRDLLPKMCAKLQVPLDCERKAFEVLDVMTKSGDFIGKRQATQAAAAILYTSKHLTTSPVPNVRELAKLAGVKEQTVKNMYEKLLKRKSGSRLDQEFEKVEARWV